MNELIAEIDRRAASVKELREREVEARKEKNYVLADTLLAQRKNEEGMYGAAYKKYCREREAVLDIPEGELRERVREAAL